MGAASHEQTAWGLQQQPHQPASAAPQGGAAWDSLGSSLALGELGAPSIGLGRELLPLAFSWTRLHSLRQVSHSLIPELLLPAPLPSQPRRELQKLGKVPQQAWFRVTGSPAFSPVRPQPPLRKRLGLSPSGLSIHLQCEEARCCSRCGWHGTGRYRPRRAWEGCGRHRVEGCVPGAGHNLRAPTPGNPL